MSTLDESLVKAAYLNDVNLIKVLLDLGADYSYDECLPVKVSIANLNVETLRVLSSSFDISCLFNKVGKLITDNIDKIIDKYNFYFSSQDDKLFNPFDEFRLLSPELRKRIRESEDEFYYHDDNESEATKTLSYEYHRDRLISLFDFLFENGYSIETLSLDEIKTLIENTDRIFHEYLLDKGVMVINGINDIIMKCITNIDKSTFKRLVNEYRFLEELDINKVLTTSFIQVHGFDIDLIGSYIDNASQETLINCVLCIINPCPSFDEVSSKKNVDYLTNYIDKGEDLLLRVIKSNNKELDVIDLLVQKGFEVTKECLTEAIKIPIVFKHIYDKDIFPKDDMITLIQSKAYSYSRDVTGFKGLVKWVEEQ